MWFLASFSIYTKYKSSGGKEANPLISMFSIQELNSPSVNARDKEPEANAVRVREMDLLSLLRRLENREKISNSK